MHLSIKTNHLIHNKLFKASKIIILFEPPSLSSAIFMILLLFPMVPRFTPLFLSIYRYDIRLIRFMPLLSTIDIFSLYLSFVFVYTHILLPIEMMSFPLPQFHHFINSTENQNDSLRFSEESQWLRSFN